MVAAGLTLGTIFLLSSRQRSRGSSGPRVQTGYPPDWPKGVTLGMGTPVRTRSWARKQAPWEIVQLVEPIEDAGIWPGNLGPFLAVIAHRESRGAPSAKYGWFGLPPELVFTGDLAKLRAYPELVRYPKFAVIAAVRRINYLQRKYEGMGLTWYDIQRAWSNENLINDRPALGYEKDVFGDPESEENHIRFEESFGEVSAANAWYEQDSNPYKPFYFDGDEMAQAFAGQVPDVFMVSDQTLFDLLDIDYKL